MRKNQRSIDIVTKNGVIDVNHYIRKARKIRNQAIKDQAVAFIEHIGKRVSASKLANASVSIAQVKPA